MKMQSQCIIEKPTVSCAFCGSELISTYSINGYRLGHCKKCATIGVLKMPSSDEVKSFYQGYKFAANPGNYRFIKSVRVKKWMARYLSGNDNRMLDVGGGGGFFARAFEEFGFGESTYIDLDADACRFASEEMGLIHVICDSVDNISSHIEGRRFDFIYCRHIIEHLVDPVCLIKACAELLSPNGVFVLQCPNGTSKEGLLFPNYWMKFLRKVRNSNRWSKRYSWWFSLTRRYGWGIDPIRHLWAISGMGIQEIFAGDDRFSVRITSASLTDPVFSPYWKPKSRWDRVARAFSKRLSGRAFQGMHLIAEIRRVS